MREGVGKREENKKSEERDGWEWASGPVFPHSQVQEKIAFHIPHDPYNRWVSKGGQKTSFGVHLLRNCITYYYQYVTHPVFSINFNKLHAVILPVFFMSVKS